MFSLSSSQIISQFTGGGLSRQVGELSNCEQALIFLSCYSTSSSPAGSRVGNRLCSFSYCFIWYYVDQQLTVVKEEAKDGGLLDVPSLCQATIIIPSPRQDNYLRYFPLVHGAVIYYSHHEMPLNSYLYNLITLINSSFEDSWLPENLSKTKTKC